MMRRSAAALLWLAATAATAAPRIETVLLQQGWTSGYNGTVALSWDPVVLYADGSYTEDADGALGPAPRVDGHWQRDGKAWRLTPRKGRPATLKADAAARPAPPGGTLQGHYRSLGGVGNASMNVPVVAVAGSLQFTRDGTLLAERAAGAATGGTATSSRARAAARYRLEGWTIAITDAQGRTETRLFYRFPDGDGAIGVGGQTLSLRR